MTPDEYVLSIVGKYSVQTGANSPAAQAGAAVAPMLQAWANQFLNGIQYSGSYAKGTAVSGGSDVDLFISLKANTPGTLKELYFSLRDYIIRYGYNPELRNVSMRIVYNGFDIDLVPGRLQSPYTTDHSLYKRRADTWIKTNIDTHINYVITSNRLIEIKTIKIWRKLFGLEFTSFYLEMAVIEALKGYKIGNYAANVITAMKWLRYNLETSTLYDPSNTNNRVSDDLTIQEKRAIALQAAEAIQAPSWGDIIW